MPQSTKQRRVAMREASARWKKRNPVKVALQYARRQRRTQHHHGRKRRCDICRRIRRLQIDHSHDYARRQCSHNPTAWHCPKCRRGSLCRACNIALGTVERNLTSVIQYLKQWRNKR